MRGKNTIDPTQSSIQSDLVIGILSGALALASLSLAIFGFLYSTFAQIMSQVGIERPPDIAFHIKSVAIWTFILACVSSLLAVMCILWVYCRTDNLLLFICGGIGFLLILLCGIIGYVIYKMMILE